MKLLLLGATGKVGRVVLQRALAQGHEVVALVRNPEKIAAGNSRLKIIPGSLRDEAQVASAMAGTDAVISTLGHNSARKSDIQTSATRTVLAHLTDKQRFISLTGHGVPDPRDVRHPLSGRLLKLIIQLLPGGVFADGLNHAQLMRDSGKNWILVRAPRIVGSASTGRFEAGYLPVALSSTVSRGDIADFILANLDSSEWLGHAPIIIGR